MRLYDGDILPQWLRLAEWPVIGREEDDEDDESEEEEEESEEDEDDDSDEEDDEDEDDEEDEDEDEDDDAEVKSKARLKKLRQDHEEERTRLNGALRKERQERRKLAKEVKDLKKLVPAGKGKPKTGSEKSEEDIKAEQDREQKGVRLAQRLQKQAIDNLVIRLAPQYKFADVDDAVKLIDRELIDVDQDEDDPADVEVDEASVKDALKELAKKKKHLLVDTKGAGGSANGRTGSTFSGKKKKDKLSDEALRKRYPALGPSRQ